MITNYPLRIATWNIGGGFVSTTHQNRFDELSIEYFNLALRRLNCDIICLQEVHTPIQSMHSPQVEALCTSLPLEYQAVYPCDTIRQSHLQEGQLLSLALFSRWPIITSEFHQLPNPKLEITRDTGAHWLSHDKGFISAIVRFYGRPIHIVTGHNVPFALFKRDFLAPEFINIRYMIEATILAHSHLPTLVAGDMNYEVIDLLLPRVINSGYVQAIKGIATEPTSKRQLDHILVSPEWRIIHSEVIPGQADHFVCYADLQLPHDRLPLAPDVAQ